MRRLFFFSAFSFSVFFMVLVIACGGESTPAKPADTPDSPQTQVPTSRPESTTATVSALTPIATPTAEPTGTPSVDAAAQAEYLEDAVFTRLGTDPTTLDPHLTGDVRSALIIVEVFGGLVTLDRNLEVAPDLAKDWEVSNDSRTYTFHLREDAKFQDGKPVTAQDVKWSIERVADPKTESPVVDVFLGDIVGFVDKFEGRATDVEGVRVIDDDTVSITIDAPKAYFLSKLTYPSAFVLDRNNVEGNPNWFEEPNGTGPFKLTEYEPGVVLRLTRNELYHLGPPKLKEVEFILSGGSSLLMYQNDEIHISGINFLDLEGILDPSNPLGEEVAQAPPDFDVAYMGMNSSMPPFDDPKVRQALNYAVDLEYLTSTLFQGLRVPAKGILPPGFPGYNANVQGYDYDPEKARQLLSESRYGGNLDEFPSITLTLPGRFGAAVDPSMEVLLQMWRDNLGIEMEIQQTEWSTFFQDLTQRRFQMFGGLAWIADYPDPENFLDVLFHSESSNNHTYYANKAVDALLEEARVEQDEQARFEIYHRVEDMILEDAPWIPLWHEKSGYVLLKPQVKDYFLFPLVIPKLRHVYLTEE